MKSAENVVVTCGSSAALSLSLLSLADVGQEVIIPDPYFISYKSLSMALGLNPVFADAYPAFELPVEKIRSAISEKTAVILLNSPNNPTGLVHEKEDIRAVCEIAEEKGITVISDEVYHGLAFEKKTYSPASEFSNVVTLNSFSKIAAIPGYRVGWASGPSEFIESMGAINTFFTAGAPLPFQIALSQASWDASGALGELREKRDLIWDELGARYDFNKPEGAFYAFLKSPSGSAASFVALLSTKGVIAAPGKGFSEKDSHFRISFAAPKPTLEQAIRGLKEAVRSVAR